MATESILNLVIDDKAQSYAKIYSSLLKGEFQRKRSYASLVALYGLVNALEKTENDIQKSMTLFRNPVLNEQYEISDFYVNNWHIDVRIIVDDEYCLIPKIHFDNEITPDFYAVVKVDKTLTTASLLGFSTPDKVEKEIVNNSYFILNVNNLISYDEFLTKIRVPNNNTFTEQEHEKFRTLYLGLMDSELQDSDKNDLIRHLFKCTQCRTEFCCFTGFEMVSCNMSSYPNIFDDLMLGIIGAQDVDKEKYAGKEEIIPITDDNTENDDTPSQQQEQNDDEQPTNEETLDDDSIDDTLNEEKETTVSDILDELFSMDDEIVEIDDTEEKTIDTNVQNNAQNSEVELIEDDTETLDSYHYDGDSNIQSSEIEMIEDVEVEPYKDSDIEVIENTLEELKVDNDDDSIVLIDSEPENLIETKDIDIYRDDNNNGIDDNLEIIEEADDIIEDVTKNSSDSVQKVIVDYDEYGEPVYSVVTNVPQDSKILEDDPTDIKLNEESDEDLLNESFEVYPEEDTNIEIDEINNGAERTVNYVTQDDIDDIEKNGDSENIEREEENSQNMDIEEEPEEYSDDEDTIEEYVDDEINDTDIQNIDDSINNESAEFQDSVEEYKDDEYQENFEEYPENEKDVDSETDEENSEEAMEYNDEYDDSADTEENMEYNDEEAYDNVPKQKKSGGILASILVFIILAVCGTGAFLFFKGKNQVESTSLPTETTNNSVETNVSTAEDSPQINDMFEVPVEDIDIPQTNGIEISQNDASMLPPPPTATDIKKPVPAKTTQTSTNNNVDINTSFANAFNGTNSVSLRGINWLCAPSLFSDAQFKQYMQGLDNVLKLNLRKNILDIVENPTKNSVTVKLAVDNNGALKKVLVADSSGSEQVDNIVLQSINETFEGENGPILSDGAQKSDIYYLKVVIKL